MTSLKFFTIIVGGGLGIRFGGDVPKLLQEVGGRTILEWSILSVYRSSCEKIVLVAPEAYLAQFFEIAHRAAGEKIFDVVAGGKTRTESVRAGLESLSKICRDDDIVAIHDGARPLASPKLFNLCAEAAASYGAAIAAIPLTDTIKIVDEDVIVETPRREKFWRAQTPQAFKFKIIAEALKGDAEFTDDAAAVEALGQKVHIVMGEHKNFKITFPEDIHIARAFLSIDADEQ